ncbi:MAG: hypothetical protein HGA49_12440, partial [Eubacteriaceae bacterium]|nr:hypothetical protein [Eubacteriaceae bacterium]
MKTEALKVIKGDHNLADYDEIRSNFDWASVEKNFAWSKMDQGKVNMAFEAIDRHVL